jgi:DNA-binding transcriptional LysR family regulator
MSISFVDLRQHGSVGGGLQKIKTPLLIARMNNFDWSDLDARSLQLLLAVLECGSVTGAAQRLGVTQSAVSHGLEKLRAITGDALFVKSGRGIAATSHAQALATPARELLRSLERFGRQTAFDPSRWRATFTIAANDFQRDLLLPALAARLREQAPQVVLRVVPSSVPRVDMLREDHCQLVISPRPPEAGDIVQKRLFEDDYRVFYDPAVRDAPHTLADYLDADHATVVYEPQRSLELDEQLATRGVQRRFAVMVPGFAALPAFLRGTPLLATVPGLLGRYTLAGLASYAPPVPCPRMPMYGIWHLRHQHDAAHRWLRSQLDAVIAPALAGAANAAPGRPKRSPDQPGNSSVSTSARACAP